MSLAASLLQQYLQQLKDQRTERIGLDLELQNRLLGTSKFQKVETEATYSRSSQEAPGFSLKQAYKESLNRVQDGGDRQKLVEPVLASTAVAASLSKEDQLDALKREFEADQKIRQCPTLRGQGVFSTGSVHAEILFLGEAPGAEEEKQQEPFVGPAGQTLTKIIQAMGLRRQEVYISNICKFRPKIENGITQGTKNRAPTREEMNLCLPYIFKEIELVKPKIIVALGATAANGLGIEGTVGRLRGNLQRFEKTPVLVTYHPSYLIRKEQEDGGGLAEKRLVWEDMMTVMEYVGIQVSPKQRAYFSKGRA